MFGGAGLQVGADACLGWAVVDVDDAVENIPSIRRKAEFCFRWIDSLAGVRRLETRADRKAFLLNVICFAACIEGLFFYGAFAYAALVARLCGDDYARFLELSAECAPQPPFGTGTPETAGPELAALASDFFATVEHTLRAPN